MKFPDLETRITKDFLLSKNSEETYMQTYLGVPVKKGLLISPLRNDRRPTASFYRNKNNELIFHDFGTGFHSNFIGVVMFKHNCTYHEALKIIAEDFGYIEKESNRPEVKIKQSKIQIEEKQETIIQIEKQNFQDYELKWWESFGIHKETLEKFKVYSCKSVFLNGTYLASSSKNSMIFGYYFGKRGGNEIWRIYFPQRKQYRFLSNSDKLIVQNSLNIPKTGDLLVICKSMKDCLLFYELGIPAIAPCSEVQFVSDQQLARLKSRFKVIVVCYDNDMTGIHFMRKIKKKHPELHYFFIPRKYAKDPSDFCKAFGIEETKKQVELLKQYYLNEEK